MYRSCDNLHINVAIYRFLAFKWPSLVFSRLPNSDAHSVPHEVNTMSQIARSTSPLYRVSATRHQNQIEEIISKFSHIIFLA